jgi:hypothetical protein
MGGGMFPFRLDVPPSTGSTCTLRMTVRAVVLPGPGTLDVLAGLQGAARAPPAQDLAAA